MSHEKEGPAEEPVNEDKPKDYLNGKDKIILAISLLPIIAPIVLMVLPNPHK